MSEFLTLLKDTAGPFECQYPECKEQAVYICPIRDTEFYTTGTITTKAFCRQHSKPYLIKEKPKGFYRHYKGGLYHVLYVGKHTETKEDMVVYSDRDHRIWIRPLEMWNEEVVINTVGEKRPRFQKVEE